MIFILIFKDGATPLLVAAQEGQHQVVDFLLKNGANVNDSMKVFEFILIV